MIDDKELLARYVKQGSQDSFAELVARHLNFVYSTALRQVRISQAAEDVTQLVFANLARKAGSLPNNVVLAGWLHRDARFTALDMLRSEKRRQVREQEASAVNTHAPNADPGWEQIRPLLDEALNRMSSRDRDVLLLRFFEQRSLKEVGTALGSGEDAARKRVARALEKLRAFLVRRGVTTSGSALSVAMAANGVLAAPASLAMSIAGSSPAAGGALAGGAFTVKLFKGLTMSQIKTAVLAIAAATGIATVVIQHLDAAKLRAENRGLLEQNQILAQLQSENERLSNIVAHPDQSSLSRAQFMELMRLRGEIGQLRVGLRAALAAKSATGDHQIPPSVKNETPDDPSQPFTATLTAHVENGEALLTGGWSTAPGKRTFILMTPAIKEAGRVFVGTYTIEIPEEQLGQFGMDQFKADGRDSSIQNVLNQADSETLLQALKTPPDGVVVTRSNIDSPPGIHGEITMGQDESSDASSAKPKYLIGLTSNMSTDQKAVDLSINEQVAPHGVSFSSH